MPWKELGGVLAMIVLLALLYVGAYFAMVEQKAFGRGSYTMVDYRFGGESVVWFFGPLHRIDRELRPEWWHDEIDRQNLVTTITSRITP